MLPSGVSPPCAYGQFGLDFGSLGSKGYRKVRVLVCEFPPALMTMTFPSYPRFQCRCFLCFVSALKTHRPLQPVHFPESSEYVGTSRDGIPGDECFRFVTTQFEKRSPKPCPVHTIKRLKQGPQINMGYQPSDTASTAPHTLAPSVLQIYLLPAAIQHTPRLRTLKALSSFAGPGMLPTLTA